MVENKIIVLNNKNGQLSISIMKDDALKYDQRLFQALDDSISTQIEAAKLIIANQEQKDSFASKCLTMFQWVGDGQKTPRPTDIINFVLAPRPQRSRASSPPRGRVSSPPRGQKLSTNTEGTSQRNSSTKKDEGSGEKGSTYNTSQARAPPAINETVVRVKESMVGNTMSY